MPFVAARSLPSGEPNGADLDLLEITVARFKATHPYLLFHKSAISSIRRRASRNVKLLARLETSLSEEASRADGEELRAGIKRRSRRLIHMSFLASISSGAKRAAALAGARATLSRFTAETSWKPRPVIKSFLDCAEVAVAVSLAYDWLYDDFSDDERRTIEAAFFRLMSLPGGDVLFRRPPRETRR